LSRLLASSMADLAALAAAEGLVASGELGAVDRWRVAQTFYRHGLYDRAIPILDDLDGVKHSQISEREVAYLRGRCSFRRGDWSTAVLWYRKAISRSSAGDRMAELEVHLGRTYELADEMDEAVAAAQRAIRIKTTDDRRLFLARLRLRRGELELAQAGLARLRSRSARDQGELMLGLYELGEGHREAARVHLARVSRDPWRSPAAVIAAELAAADDKEKEALDLLAGAAPGLDGYWAEQARAIMRQLADDVLQQWRRDEAAAMEDSVERTRRRALVRSLVLEFDRERLAGLRAIAAASVGLEGEPEQPVFPPGLAARLWALGLPASAVKWDPSGLPREAARSTWWTAVQELELGRPWLAISVADAAWRQASSSLPEEGLPRSLRTTLYPLPFEPTLRRAAARHELPWALLAGVAREESRWNPIVVSKVGARGLMQLMPATAIATGSANGRPEMVPDDLFEPLISLDLGAAELGRLLRVFEGNRAAAVAAYNAGEAQARVWLAQCGEGCTEARYLAHVSFSVTRAYTEAVLGATAAYDGLYGAPSGSGLNERSE
jgi:soluble lytic murein transglycosylase-like protein